MKDQLWYSVVVRDRHGKVIARERRRSRSFLKQWNQLMFVQMTNAPLAGADQIYDMNGVLKSIGEDDSNFRMESHNSYTGIMCGTGDTPVAIDDYQLEALIANGSGAGQLQNVAMAIIGDVALDGSSAKFVVSRSPLNWSGGDITVKEIGIYCAMYVPPSAYYMCAVRDVLETPLLVPDGGGITVDYTLAVAA